jgi:uncharacterized protein YcaQ
MPEPRAAVIAPLDNILWDRRLLLELYGFDYRWEVYVPGPKRRYGYYVLPVLCGDRFVARIDPAFDRASRTFVVQNWWWEQGVDTKDEAMLAAIGDCLAAFRAYLGATGIRLEPTPSRDRALAFALKGATPAKAAKR